MGLKFKLLISKVFQDPKVLIMTSVAALLLCLVGSQLFFTDYVAQARILVVSGTRGDEEASPGGESAVSDRSMRTTANVLKSRQIMEEVVAELNLEDTFGKGNAVDKLLSMVKVSPVRGTNIMEISVASKKPELATHIANAICKILITGSAKEQFSFEKDMLSWLSKETAILRKDVEDAAAELRESSKHYGIADLRTEYETTIDRMKKLQVSLAAIRAERQESEAAYHNIQNFLKAGTKPESLIEVKNDYEYMELASEYMFLRKERAAVLKKYNMSHPDIIEMTDKMEMIKEMLAARTKSVIAEAKIKYEVFRTREVSLGKIVKEENERLLDLETKIDKYNSLLNDLREKENIYNTFVEKSKNGFRSGVKVQKIDLLEQAYLPKSKNKPPTPAVVFTGLLIGLAAGGSYNLARYGKDIFTEEAKPAMPKNKGMYIERVQEEDQKKDGKKR